MAFTLSKMTPSDRFVLFAGNCAFNVFGLSQTMSRTRDFQKLMALLQAVSSIPMLLQVFFTKYSPNKVLSSMIKMLGINPDQMARDEEELNSLERELQGLPFFQELATGGKGGGGQGSTTQSGSSVSAEQTGGPELPAEIASVGNPSAGLAGVGSS